MFKRGFKAWCEQTAETVRRQRGLQAWEPLRAHALGIELAAKIITPTDLNLDSAVQQRLVTEHADVWSAITVSSHPPVIVLNTAHSPARQNSDLMHELAHLLLEHTPATVFIDPKSKMALRHHDVEQEEQANWLAACLLLPREALLRIRRQNCTEESACELYLVSQKMLSFRMNTSGVNIQFTRRRQYSRSHRR